jgi:hypothetical protein
MLRSEFWRVRQLAQFNKNTVGTTPSARCRLKKTSFFQCFIWTNQFFLLKLPPPPEELSAVSFRPLSAPVVANIVTDQSRETLQLNRLILTLHQ